MYRSVFSVPGDVFAEFDRMQRNLQQLFDYPASIRSTGRGAFPPVNVATTAESVEIDAFAPGVDPAKFQVTLDRGVLTISGERSSDVRPKDERTTVYAHERFAGSFKRVVSLPDDVDPTHVEAAYRDGVLHITVKRRGASQPRRIAIQ